MPGVVNLKVKSPDSYSYYCTKIPIHHDTQNDDTAGYIKSSAVIAKLLLL